MSTNGNGQAKQVKQVKAVIYARFSPRPNAAECESCEAQLSALRQYCAGQGWEIVAEFKDEAVSGKKGADSRPGLYLAELACKRGYVLLVEKFDRLFRNIYEALVFSMQLERRGIRLVSAQQESACEDSPEGRLLRHVIMAIDQYYREVMAARTKARMLMYQDEQGRRMGDKPPFGYRVDPYDKKKLVRFMPEQQTIATMKLWLDQGLNCNQIAHRLNDQQIRTRKATGKWCHKMVQRVLVRAGYLEH